MIELNLIKNNSLVKDGNASISRFVTGLFRTGLISFIFIIFFTGFGSAEAAVINLSSDDVNFDINQEFTVDIKIDSEENAINASQATIEFPSNILELVGTDKRESSFNFWVEEPLISNEDGTLKFIGGTAKGISGESLQILKLKFKAVGVGSANIFISNAAVTASDGRGTNVLSTTEGLNINVGTKSLSPTKTPVLTEEIELIIQPQKMVRQTVAASELPKKPEITVQLYPDQSKWYSHTGDVTALWNLPLNVTQIATRLSRSRDEKPGEKQEELFNGKKFGHLEEGIWYIRVQFRNNLGWGELAYYKISIDTTVPLPFEIEIDNEVSDNPSPTIQYKTQDSLSGIDKIRIYVDGVDSVVSATTTATLPPQKPGKHIVSVRVFDRAGNSIEDNLEFEIIPLSSPVISFITHSVSQGEFIFTSGKTIPNTFVDIIIKNSANQEIFSGSTLSDESGNWEAVIEEPFASGRYKLQINARDERGAVSLVTEAETVKVKGKIIITIGFFDIGWFEILLFVILLAVSGVSVILYIDDKNQKKRRAYQIVAIRDVKKFGKLLETDIEALKDWFDNEVDVSTKEEADHFFKKIKDTTSRIKKYISKELSDIE